MKRIFASFVSLAAVLSPTLAFAGGTLTVGTLTPSAATLNAAQTYSAAYASTYAVTGCNLYADGSDQGAMSLSGGLSGIATKSFSIGTTGTHSLYARCSDNYGQTTSGATANVFVSLSSSADMSAPSAPSSLAVTSVSGSTTPSFRWNASTDNTGVTGYEIQIDGGAFAPVGNAMSHTVSGQTDGSHTFGVRARDTAGNASSVATVSFTVNAPIIAPSLPPRLQPPFELPQMSADASLVGSAASRTSLEGQTARTCEFSGLDSATRVSQVFGTVADANMRASLENFVGCGTISSRWLGAGERIGALNSYRAAFGRLPSTAAHWSDVMKIANGRFTAEVSASAEAAAKVSFKKIYRRDPDMNAEHDRNAVMIMAYGLRPQPRNLSAEASAIVTFKAVYGRNPSSAQDWDAVRATAYSGATR